MGGKFGFIPILIGKLHLPGAALSVQGKQYCGITKIVSKFVHMRYGIWMLNEYCIEIAIVHVKSGCSVFLRYKHNWSRPFCLIWYNYIHCGHFVDLIFSNSRVRGEWLVWCWINWFVYSTKLIRLDVLSPWFDQTVSPIYILKFGQHWYKFSLTCHVIVWHFYLALLIVFSLVVSFGEWSMLVHLILFLSGGFNVHCWRHFRYFGSSRVWGFPFPLGHWRCHVMWVYKLYVGECSAIASDFIARVMFIASCMCSNHGGVSCLCDYHVFW